MTDENRTIWDPERWEDFKAEALQIRASGLKGDALMKRIEQAWAPLFEGTCEDDGAQIYEDAMRWLAAAAVIPANWAP